MTDAPRDQAPTTQKALAYWRKNYLFGVARPGALSYDGTTLTCVDNDLKPVFSGPLTSVTVKKGFGIFKVYVDGSRVSLLTPRGGGTSPSPSKPLLGFLQQTSGPSAAGQVGSVGAMVAGGAVGGAVGGAMAGAGAVGEALAVASYVKGTKALGQFLTAIGALRS